MAVLAATKTISINYFIHTQTVVSPELQGWGEHPKCGSASL